MTNAVVYDGRQLPRGAAFDVGTVAGWHETSLMILNGGMMEAGSWTHGISGELPMLIVRVVPGDNLALLLQVLHAHEHWRLMALTADLVALNDLRHCGAASGTGAARVGDAIPNASNLIGLRVPLQGIGSSRLFCGLRLSTCQALTIR